MFFFYEFDETTGITSTVDISTQNFSTEDYEFFNDNVRKIWHKQQEEWYFSIVDVCQVLTESVDGRNYWKVLKNRLIKEGNQTVTNCNRLKMLANDGRMRFTDCATTEQLLRLIQSIAGTLFFNSTLRHLADICYDQFTHADPANSNIYEQYAKSAKHVTKWTANTQHSYFGASEYYWANLNQYDITTLVKSSTNPMLIINSKNDVQLFDEDITLWNTVTDGMENVSIVIDETINHFGYEFDVTAKATLRQPAVFPQKIIDSFADFINRQ